ncbi:MAG TPA: PP2C family serine/threonine-protein phosphatase [Actinomycetota bacterium]|nr:PP2C family serine/threonine-protein phosphatase [Actinomycetota bacterium]
MCPADEQPVPVAPDPQSPSEAPGRMASEGASDTVEWAYICDIGTGRDNNEDYAGACTPERAEPLFVVADGMGGHAAGEVASRLAVETVVGSWAGDSVGSGAAHQRLRSAVRAANVAVFDASHDAGRRGMGSTLTALVLAGKEAVIAHAGDSRAYLIREGQASQLTADHSRVGEMLRMRLITAEQAARHPARSMLTRSLGTEPMLQIDLVREPAEPGDSFVLCSDGLWDSVARGEIAEIVSGSEDEEAPDCPTAAARLIELALKRDAPDNVTVAVIRLVAHGPTSGGRRLFRRFSRGG